MAESILSFIAWIDMYLWQKWTFLLLMGAGILFTLWTRFCQYRALTHGVQVIRGVYDDPDDPGAVNHFQALSAALSGTVGLGNIGSVAIAISTGGPGALFWMWAIGFLGMAIKTVEVTLALMYRNTDEKDNPHGGAMFVIDKTLGAHGGVYWLLAKILGGTFAVTCLISTMTGGNMFQAASVAGITEVYFDIPRVVTGIVMAVTVGLVIIGGIKRIGDVAGRLVPLMCLLYLCAAFAVLAMHIDEIPGLLALVVRSAFSETEAAGAFLGGTLYHAFTVGLRRALFSNEAGQGSSPIAHSAAKTDEAAREGVVGGLEPFIDTICICTLTALVILSTGTWNRGPVGELQAQLGLVEVSRTPEAVVYQVEAPPTIDILPTLARNEKWSLGWEPLLLAQVPQNRNRSTGTNRVAVGGSIVKSEDGSRPPGIKAGELFIQWKTIELNAADWQEPLGSLELIDKQVYPNFTSAALTAYAFDREFPGLGKWLVTICAWLFAISTMISWSYYGEQSMVYLLGRAGVLPYQFVFLVLAIVAAAAIRETGHLEAIMDLGTGAMLWANMPIVLLMGYRSVHCIDDYFRRLRAGEFHPHAAPPIVDVAAGKDVE